MRRLALSLVFAVWFLPGLAAQTTQSVQTATSPPSQATGDPQALSVSQAALDAFGDATAIGQIQSWTIHATLQGVIADNDVTYTIDTQAPWRTVTTKDGRQHPVMTHSLFVPVVLAAVLAKQLQDQRVAVRARRTAAPSEKSVLIGPAAGLLGQTWFFDSATGLPTHIELNLPMVLGSRISYAGAVDLGDWRSVAGVMYPFRVVNRFTRNGLRELITIQSIAPSAALPDPTTRGFNLQAGDHQ